MTNTENFLRPFNMPFINIENSGKGNNKGSCRALVNYLCKENEGKPATEKEHFFSYSETQINRLAVTRSIDSNVRKLGKSDSKFFMLTLNFSEKEIAHVQNDPERIRLYASEVMELYAKNFNKGLQSSDLVWFAKIEFNRSFKGFEPEVINGIHNQGDNKPGLNTHVHIIISRKDKHQKLKLSPMTNHRRSSNGIIKSGFNRMNFKIESEKSFDRLFDYKREHSEFLIVANTLKNGSREQKLHMRQAMYKKQSPLLAALNVVVGAKAYYPQNEQEKEQKKKKKENNQEQSYDY